MSGATPLVAATSRTALGSRPARAAARPMAARAACRRSPRSDPPGFTEPARLEGRRWGCKRKAPAAAPRAAEIGPGGQRNVSYAAAAMIPATGSPDIVSHYRLVELLGRGGMGE